MARTTKPVVKKTATKPIKKAGAKTAVKAVKKVVHSSTGLSASVLDTDGKTKGKMALSKEVFGVDVNKELMAQAVRVYLANQREGSASTKTRGKVEGSTRKIYRQKGTGRARHGSIRAPIFVGGGIVFGPQPHSFAMKLPVRMKHKALASALTSQYEAGNVVIADGLHELKPKTKFMAKALAAMECNVSTLLVLGPDAGMVARSARNIQGIDVVPAASVTTYEVLAHKKVVFMKDAVATLTGIVTKEA